MMKNNYSTMVAFFLLIFIGCIISTDGWANYLERPKFTIKRISGTNQADIVFKSTKTELQLFRGMSNIGVYAWVGGVGALHDVAIFTYHSDIDCDIDGDACFDYISEILGKSYNVMIPWNDKGTCLAVGNAGIGNAFNMINVWGTDCTEIPPPDCVGDECNIDEGGKPEPSLSCSVETSSINLAFGNMSMGSAVGKTASGKINVNCNKAGAKLTMSLKSGGSSISLSNGMTTALTAGGKSLGSTISASKGDNSITVQGTLEGTEKEGGFSGSGVLVTDYQ